MTRRKRIVFALIAMTIPVALISIALLATDLYLHGRFARSAGFNVWGYRGPVAARKGPGEYRAVVLGGSTAFGYGVAWDQAFPALLERDLLSRSSPRFSVINLGYNNEGAYSFVFTLRDYRYLNYDLVILYEGYNDMIGDKRNPNLSVFRHDSPVFRLTGYLPIFPMIFNEKAAVMLTGNVAALYPGAEQKEQKTVFRPGLATQTTAEILKATANIVQSLGRQLDRVSPEEPRHIAQASESGCRAPWAEYCRSMEKAVTVAIGMDKQVLVVTQPHPEMGRDLRPRHLAQQHEMAAMIERRFGGNPRVRYVDLGSAVDLSNPALTFDGMHLNSTGNQMIADALVEPVVRMAASVVQSANAR
jgi:hypothetical protein